MGSFISVSPSLILFTAHNLGEIGDGVDTGVKHTRELAEAERRIRAQDMSLSEQAARIWDLKHQLEQQQRQCAQSFGPRHQALARGAVGQQAHGQPHEGIEQPEGEDLYERLSIIIDKGQDPLRIDKYLMSRIEGATRNKIQQAIDNEMVLVAVSLE